MKLSRMGAVSLSAAAAALVGTPLAAHALTTQEAHASAAASYAVYNCANKPVAEPKTFAFTCDSSGYLTKLTWNSWNAATATATGVFYTDNCTPNFRGAGSVPRRVLMPVLPADGDGVARAGREAAVTPDRPPGLFRSGELHGDGTDGRSQRDRAGLVVDLARARAGDVADERGQLE